MRILKPTYVAILALFLVFTTAAQQPHEWKQSTSNGYTYRYVTNDPMKARFYTLSNGLTVILSPNAREPRIRALVGVRAGSNSDPRDHTGLAHYLEHLLFKGTYRYGSADSVKEKPFIDQITKLYDIYNQTTDPFARRAIYHVIDSVSGLAAAYAIPNEYSKIMSTMGGQETNAHTSVEETVFEETIPTNMLDRYLALQSERFSNPVFRLFHTELEAVYEEKNRALDNDSRKVWEALLAGLFPTHNYGQQSTLGTVEHLKNPSLTSIRKFYDTYYVPGNMAMILAGDFNPDEVIAKVDKALSVWPAKPVATYEGPKEAPLTSPVSIEVVGPDAENISIGFRLPGVVSRKEDVILSVVSELLSNGKAGLMDLHLNKQQRVLSSITERQPWKDYSVLVLAGNAKQGQSLEQLKDLLLAQIDSLRAGAFDESLIRAIAANYKLQELNELESNDNRANALMTAFIQHRGEDWTTDVAYGDDMRKVTRQQVIDFVKKYLGNNYVVVYKRKGESKNVVKVDKPPITPLKINKDVQSSFASYLASLPTTPLQPKWLDFDREIGKAKAGAADVLYVQNRDNELFRLYYRFDMGNWNDRRLSLAANYLPFLGDDKHTAEEISRAFYNIACNFNVTPGNENMMITISGLQENFTKAVQLFENLVLHCKADTAALENLKARTIKGRSDAKASKNNIISGLFNYAMYGEKNPFNYKLNNTELQAVTANELVDLLHNLFQYKHTVIYYGPRKISDFTADIRKAHAIPASFRAAPRGATFEKKESAASRVLFVPYDMVQAEVAWVNNLSKYDSSLAPQIELFNSYFGLDMSSVVFQTIRESKALAYATFAFYAAPDRQENRFTMEAYVGTQADKLQEAVAAMNGLLDSLPHSDQLIANGKENIRQNIASERITEDAVVFSYLAARRMGIHSDLRKFVYDRVPKLTFADLQNFHRQQVAGKPYTYCVLGSPSRVKVDDLHKLGEFHEVSLTDIFGY